MKEESGLVTVAGRRLLSGLPIAASAKLAVTSDVATISEPTLNEDGSVVRVKAQVMTRSDEGWVAVDGGGLSLVGVFRHIVQVPIAAVSPSSLQPRPTATSTSTSASTRHTEKEADAYSSCRSTATNKTSRKELLDEPDSAIECSVTDEEKQTDACKVQCYECTEFRIRAQRISDGNLLLNYVLNKDLAYHQPQPLFHHWRCICEACKRGSGSGSRSVSGSGSGSGSASVSGPGSGLPHQRSLLSHQCSTNSSLSGWGTRASNNYVNLPTGKQRLSKNASVDSSNIHALTSIADSSSSAFGSHILPQQLVAHNHGSFGLTFESSADARAFDAAVRHALKTLDSEAKTDAVRIGVYQVASSPRPSPSPSVGPLYQHPLTQPPTIAAKSESRSASVATNAIKSRTIAERKQSSSDPACDRRGIHSHSHHQSATKTLSDPTTTSLGTDQSRLKQQLKSRTRHGDHDEYECLWDPSITVVARSPVTATAHKLPVASLDFESIEPAKTRATCDLRVRAAVDWDATPRRLIEPDADTDADVEIDAEIDAPYMRLADCEIGARQADPTAKRSSSLSRLNHFGVGSRARSSTPNANSVLNTAANTSANLQMESQFFARESSTGSPFQPACSKRCTSYSMHARGTKANANLYVCSSYPHLAANNTQLHSCAFATGQNAASATCTRSSPSANATCCTNVSASVKPESSSPRFLRLFRLKQRGSRCDSVSVSSVSLLTNVQQQAPRRSSRRPAAATGRQPLTRARCMHCQQVYFVERNQRGACGDAPAAAQRRVRSTRYFRAAEACVHCVLDSDDSDIDAFADDRGRSSRSHSSVRSSGVHEHEDSGISTFSTSVSHTRRQLMAATRRTTDEPCCACSSCGNFVAGRHKRRRYARWTLVALLSCLLPCLWCYWPMACCSAAASSCCARCVGARHEPMPPSVVADQTVLSYKP